MSDRHFLVQHEQQDYKVNIENNRLASPQEDYLFDEGHVAIYKDLIILQGMTVFAGHLTGWGAIKWGVKEIWRTFKR